MSILSLALQAVREGPDSSAMPLLRALAVSEERPCIVAVDFDGTLCENQWPGIGRENLPVISAVSLLRELGILVVLWTCREGEDLENALEWCGQRDIRFDAVFLIFINGTPEKSMRTNTGMTVPFRSASIIKGGNE